MNEISLEQGRYATTGRMDEAFYLNNMKYLLSRRYMAQLWTLRGLALALCVMLCCLWGTPLFLAVAVFYMALSFLAQARRVRKIAQLNVRRMKEATPEGVMIMTTSFHEDGVHGHNETTGGKGVLPYESLTRLKETDEHLLLMTKAEQFQVVFKQQLEQKDVDALLAYLKEKCPEIKTSR